MDIIRADQRGVAEHGWLSSRHTFSFGSYYNPEQIGFSDLRVIHDDHVEAGEGFGRHPHRDMEIFSYVLAGPPEHKDQNGRASWRESVCQYGWISVVAVSLKKKK